MQEHYLEHLFTEYKNCLHNEFEEYIGLEDEYKSYYDKCWKQKNDISNLYNSLFANHTQTNPEDQMWYQQVQIDKYKNQFMRNGWNARQTENYFLNRDRSHEEYDVWTNHVLGEDTLTSMGITDMFEGPDGLHQRTMRWISKTYQQPFKVPLTDLKPKGKLAQDYWYARRHLKQL